eukprot:gnl/TRDRNA2_/TRDRNA2_156724_c0_seq2.p1 gnl/TRDRNA2_/TRDRNA2_156724_c0~~gnl/TRDRNA2_/TRDRNA2_156724_c0_seq2.p1  ORF type:complete len:418 (+),score=59.00 gnl/TRDRNA2_/TRDRNA2_156724_c0_seq2:176-1255(+)
MDKHEADTIFIFAGYEEKMKLLLDSNEGLRRRIPEMFRFPEFDANAFQYVIQSKAKQQQVGLLRDISAAELEEKLSQYSRSARFNGSEVRDLPGTSDDLLAFLEDHLSLGPAELQRLFRSIPKKMRDMMGGHIANLILEKAYASRITRLSNDHLIDLEHGLCLPDSKVFRKIEQSRNDSGHACPVLSYYTLADLTAARNSMVKVWNEEKSFEQLPSLQKHLHKFAEYLFQELLEKTVWAWGQGHKSLTSIERLVEASALAFKIQRILREAADFSCTSALLTPFRVVFNVADAFARMTGSRDASASWMTSANATICWIKSQLHWITTSRTSRPRQSRRRLPVLRPPQRRIRRTGMARRTR